MATAKQQLLANMNPQMARLLDNQMRDQQVAQRSQGAGMLAGLTQAYTGMGDLASRALGAAPMGANEMQAIQAQEAQQKQQLKMSGVKQGITKVAGSSLKSPDKQLIIQQLANGTISPDAVDGMLRNAQQAVPSTSKFVDYIGMYAGNLEDFDPASIIKANAEFRKGKKEGEDDSDMYIRITTPLIKKLSKETKENAQELRRASKGYASFETNLPRLLESVDNANVGLAGDFKQFMAKSIETITGGVVDVDTVEDTELLGRFFNREVLDAAGLMTGALTNYDIEFLKDATGNRGFSREGLKEALKDLFVAKKTAYETYKAFAVLPNTKKETFDMEEFQLGVMGGINEQVSSLFGVDFKKQPSRVLLPNQGDTPSSKTMSFAEYFGNKQ